jgi:hypothetical protein
MTQAKHTPGPWSVDRLDTDLVTADCDGMMICYTSNADRDESAEGTVEANARLIAASPKMLAALERLSSAIDGMVCLDTVLDHSGDFYPALREARAVIAEAKSE